MAWLWSILYLQARYHDFMFQKRFCFCENPVSLAPAESGKHCCTYVSLYCIFQTRLFCHGNRFPKSLDLYIKFYSKARKGFVILWLFNYLNSLQKHGYSACRMDYFIFINEISYMFNSYSCLSTHYFNLPLKCYQHTLEVPREVT